LQWLEGASSDSYSIVIISEVETVQLISIYSLHFLSLATFNEVTAYMCKTAHKWMLQSMINSCSLIWQSANQRRVNRGIKGKVKLSLCLTN
jgi:hypothetical protein